MAPAAGRFDELLGRASQATLIGALRAGAIPDELTDTQKERVRFLLGEYRPETLETCAWIDADGVPLKPVPIDLNSTDEIDVRQNPSAIVSDYSAYLLWQAEHLEIRTVREVDVTKSDHDIVGQRGLFARNDIPEGTVIPFGGMVLVQLRDKQQGRIIRQRANCDRYRISNRADGSIVEGMGMAMMMNTALEPTFSCGGDRRRNNFSLERVDFLHKDRGEFWTLPFLRANRNIRAGEHLCYAYGSGHPRYFQTGR